MFPSLHHAQWLWKWNISRGFRSNAALEAIAKASSTQETTIPQSLTLALYNYPSFSGAFSALFAHLFHSRLNLPCLLLPFSSVAPFRVEDLKIDGLERCYLLDFIGPPGFAAQLSRQSLCQVVAFDHRKSAYSTMLSMEDCPKEVTFHVDMGKSSSHAVYEYFSDKFADLKSTNGEVAKLLNRDNQECVEMVLKYIEDADLRLWSLPDVRAFHVGLRDWRSKINCVSNPFMFEELLELRSIDLIAKGKSIISSRKSGASKLLGDSFKLRLGGGFYGDCLGVRADGNSHLSDEIGKQLSLKSAASGLRPIGAVVYMQGNNLKMCLRSMDKATDTSEVAKAYGGGGSPSSSSFIIRMDEYNQWHSPIKKTGCFQLMLHDCTKKQV